MENTLYGITPQTTFELYGKKFGLKNEELKFSFPDINSKAYKRIIIENKKFSRKTTTPPIQDEKTLVYENIN